MKQLMSALQFTAVLAVSLSIITTGCNKADAAAEASTNVAVMPGAELVFKVDLAGMRGSTIYDKLNALAEKNNLGKDESRVQKLDQFSKDLQEITGLTKDDLSQIVLSMSFKDVDFSGDEPKNMDSVKAILAATLEKSLSVDQLEQAAKKSAEANTEENIQISRSAHNGTPIIEVKNIDEAAETFSLAMAGDNRLLLAGTDAELKSALDRVASGKEETAPELGESHLNLQFILPETLRTKLRSSAQEEQAGPGGQGAAMAKTMQTLERIGLTVNLEQNMDVALAATMASDEDARQLKSMLDNQVLSFVRMMAQMMTGGQPLNVLDSLATKQDAGQVKLSFSLSPADVDVFEKAAEQQKQMEQMQGTPPAPPQD